MNSNSYTLGGVKPSHVYDRNFYCYCYTDIASFQGETIALTQSETLNSHSVLLKLIYSDNYTQK